RPDGAFDPRFVPIGQKYVPGLGKDYAEGWEDGAKILDAGQPIGTALDTVAKSWEANRTGHFRAMITPEFSKVVAEQKPEKDVTPEDRASLAKAWRGFAKGL